MNIREILLKEEEKHRLTYIGIIHDLSEIITQTENSFLCPDASFLIIKMQLVDYFYSSMLNYENFINEEKVSNSNLKQHHFKKTKKYISTLSDGKKAELDIELKTPAGIAFAWHFSNEVYNEFYGRFCKDNVIYKTPQETDEFFFVESKKIYPLTLNKVVDRLTVNDSSFWNICAAYIQHLSRITVSFFLQRSDDFNFSDLVKDNVVTDAYKVLQDRLIEKKGNDPKFENGRDFRNYIIKICQLLARNSQRKYMHKDEYIEDLPQMKSSFEDDEDTDIPYFVEEEYENADLDNEKYDMDIDINNPFEVAHTISIVLLNSNHPFHEALVNGIEDKVKILIDKSVNEMSYNDIISEQHANRSLSDENFKRAVVKARKDFERVRKVLCDRLINLVKKNNDTCHKYAFSHIVL